PEVAVCFDSKLYRGNRTLKAAVADYDAFESPNFPLLGTLGVTAQFSRGLPPRRLKLVDRLDPRVFLLKIYPGLDPALPMGLLGRMRGLVVEAYGAGNVPVDEAGGRSLQPVFREARRRGVAVVVVSQAPRNAVDLSLYEGGVAALAEGAIGGGDMTSVAAGAKLLHGRGVNRARPAIRRGMGGGGARRGSWGGPAAGGEAGGRRGSAG